MKHIKLYAYSYDQALMDWLSFLVETEDADIFICSTESELNDLYHKGIPDILLIDDDTKVDEHDTAELIIDTFVPRKKRGASMVLVLSSQASHLEYRVNLLLKGVDYIIEKPVNMIELIARINAMVRHQKYVQERIHDYMVQTRDITTFDTMDKILTYLNDHIKPHIEEHIAIANDYDDTQTLDKEFVDKIKNDGIKILAVLNAIREDIHEFISVKDNKKQEYDHLEQLFRKNFDLITMAYDGYTQTRKNKE